MDSPSNLCIVANTILQEEQRARTDRQWRHGACAIGAAKELCNSREQELHKAWM